MTWLLDVQNRDGGIPTFCRGWGALPFDQSSADITAHAIRAWLAWFDEMPYAEQRRVNQAISRATRFLRHAQRADGSWVPLWFGNQHASGDENPTYGTSRVVCALAEFARRAKHVAQGQQQIAYDDDRLVQGIQWIAASQKPDGSWSGITNGPASVEETALSIEALAACVNAKLSVAFRPPLLPIIANGLNWLLARVESGEWTKPSPIGFYFAKLWYYEKLYPMIFTIGALNRVLRLQNGKGAESIEEP